MGRLPPPDERGTDYVLAVPKAFRAEVPALIGAYQPSGWLLAGPDSGMGGPQVSFVKNPDRVSRL